MSVFMSLSMRAHAGFQITPAIPEFSKSVEKAVSLVPAEMWTSLAKNVACQSITIFFMPPYFRESYRLLEPVKGNKEKDKETTLTAFVCCKRSPNVVTYMTVEVIASICNKLFPLKGLFNPSNFWKNRTLQALNLPSNSSVQILSEPTLSELTKIIIENPWIETLHDITPPFDPSNGFQNHAIKYLSECLLENLGKLISSGVVPCIKMEGQRWERSPLPENLHYYIDLHLTELAKGQTKEFETLLKGYTPTLQRNLQEQLKKQTIKREDQVLSFLNHPLVIDYIEKWMSESQIKNLELYFSLSDKGSILIAPHTALVLPIRELEDENSKESDFRAFFHLLESPLSTTGKTPAELVELLTSESKKRCDELFQKLLEVPENEIPFKDQIAGK